MVCVTYCMYTRKDILKFVFDVFDKDGSGTIDEKEVRASDEERRGVHDWQGRACEGETIVRAIIRRFAPCDSMSLSVSTLYF